MFTSKNFLIFIILCVLAIDSQQVKIHKKHVSIRKAVKNVVESEKDNQAIREASGVATHLPTSKKLTNKIKSKPKSEKK